MTNEEFTGHLLAALHGPKAKTIALKVLEVAGEDLGRLIREAITYYNQRHALRAAVADACGLSEAAKLSWDDLIREASMRKRPAKPTLLDALRTATAEEFDEVRNFIGHPNPGTSSPRDPKLRIDRLGVYVSHGFRETICDTFAEAIDSPRFGHPMARTRAPDGEA